MAAALLRYASLPSPSHLLCIPDRPHLRLACNQCGYLSINLTRLPEFNPARIWPCICLHPGINRVFTCNCVAPGSSPQTPTVSLFTPVYMKGRQGLHVSQKNLPVFDEMKHIFTTSHHFATSNPSDYEEVKKKQEFRGINTGEEAFQGRIISLNLNKAHMLQIYVLCAPHIMTT